MYCTKNKFAFIKLTQTERVPICVACPSQCITGLDRIHMFGDNKGQTMHCNYCDYDLKHTPDINQVKTEDQRYGIKHYCSYECLVEKIQEVEDGDSTFDKPA